MEIRVKDIKVKEGTTKSGANAGKPWKLIIIIGEDGTEFTTFDAGAQEVGVGGVIELEPVIKAGKINFTEFKIIEKGSFQQAPVLTAKDGMTPELWAEKDRIERHSIETQTAYKGIMELATKHDTPNHISGKFGDVFDAALDWAMAHFQTTKPTTPPIQKPTPEATTATAEPPKPETDSPVLKPAEILQGHCKTLGWGAKQWHDYLFENFGVKKLGDLDEKQVQIATNNLRAMAQVKEAGETSEIEPDGFNV